VTISSGLCRLIPMFDPWSFPLSLVQAECEILGTFLATEECTDAEETI